MQPTGSVRFKDGLTSVCAGAGAGAGADADADAGVAARLAKAK